MSSREPKRSIPPIDPKKAALVERALEEPKKDPIPEPSPDQLSIDGLLNDGLRCIYLLMRIVKEDITARSTSRETVMNLKDAMTMLHELKKKEQELLEDMDDEQLEKLASQED